VSRLVLRNVELDRRRVDVVCADGMITSVTEGGSDQVDLTDPIVIEGAGGAVLPGLHDHHIHLLATDAASRSVAVGPEHVAGIEDLGRVLRAATADADGWVRAVGYHDSVAGPLDRSVLDRLVGDRPVRVQHRSGAMWILSSAAVRSVDLDGDAPPGAERDDDERPNGRLVRLDDWLRQRLPAHPAPDLAGLARELNRLGITGVTDATPVTTVDELDLLATAETLRVQATGGPALIGAEFPPGLRRGPVKVVLSDHDLPALDDLAAWFVDAHRYGRVVAVHCVTRSSLVLGLAAWELAGSVPGDRIEHGSVIPAELIPTIGRLGLTVVTQPGFIGERGDQYLADVDADDLGDLYRCASLIEAGALVAGSSDAPYTRPDPWAAIADAVDRRSPSGAVLGAAERLPAGRALDLYLGALEDPGGPPRRVHVGEPADLIVLSTDLASALAAPSAELVSTTLVRGEVVHRR
jgi:predicted amidohydrolase YtcJ